jgi:hypothetical protein
MHNLFGHAEAVLVSTGLVASNTSTDFYTNGVDTRGYDAIAFIAHLDCTGTPSTTFGIAVQMSATSSALGTWINAYGSTALYSTGLAVDSGLVISDVFKPKYRWARIYVDRGTTGESIISVSALRYRAHFGAPAASTTYGVAGLTMAMATSS